MAEQNDFLTGLGNITNNEQAEIEAIKKEFAAHMDKRVNIWVEKTVEKIKKEIEDKVLKREYEAANGKKVVTGTLEFSDFSCDLEMKKKRYYEKFNMIESKLLKKIRERNLSFPEYDDLMKRAEFKETREDYLGYKYADYLDKPMLLVKEVQKSLFQKARYICKVHGKYILEYGRRLPQKLSQEGINFKGFCILKADLSRIEDDLLIPLWKRPFYDDKGRPRMKPGDIGSSIWLHIDISYQVCF